MSKRFASLFATLALAIGLLAPNAFAQLSVTATQATGQRGGDVNVTMTVGAGGVTDEVNLAAISSYTFNFLWDASVLSWNSYTSTVDLSASGPTVLPGSAVFNWYDGMDSLAAPGAASFVGGLSITASFHILNTAAFGSSTILFGDSQGSSILFDENINTFEFSDVTQHNQMQVTVTPVPEPAEISMLLAGLGLMAAVIRRRKNRQA
ncbi:MAG: PEP-CTERM sorting domain-containing protein [Azonexus sp.]|jgi:hypothetical protein|nr:PEP-CTERM sorting domain-containing protein [Azonexus sp.]